jgi:polyhydroxybutyrate depolymerase
MRRSLAVLFTAALALTACSSTADSTSTAAPDTTVADTTADTTAVTESPTTDQATTLPAATDPVTTDSVVAPDPARPYDVFVPTSYQKGTPAPLVILLHGYGASGAIQEAYFQVQPLAEERGFLYVHPDGTVNQVGDQYWNATDACCGFGSTVDDSAYLLSIIDAVSAEYTVDPKRVFVFGHSNGGFMSYRMACDHADRIAAIASLAGETFLDPADCSPSEPVSVLQVQGTADGTISYEGGRTPVINKEYPGSRQTVSTWAQYDGCSPTATVSETGLDIEQSIEGQETEAETFDGCPPGIDVSLWTIDGGSHIPNINTATTPYPLTKGIIDFLLSHPKA